MARKPRIEIAGYYHIVNRGVERRVVFIEKYDFEYFIELLSNTCDKFNIVLHNYCLMSNHYHLLIEVKEENLSKFMRYLNSTYAIYFNKKYKRVGHLWQGRYKSRYVANEAYLYTLMRYIEQNPIKAKMVKNIEDYPYSSSFYFLRNNFPKHLKDSWIAKNYKEDEEGIKIFFSLETDNTDLIKLEKASSLVETINKEKSLDEEYLVELLKKEQTIEERNRNIVKAYKEGYSQYKIAKILEISQPAVSRIIRKGC